MVNKRRAGIGLAIGVGLALWLAASTFAASQKIAKPDPTEARRVGFVNGYQGLVKKWGLDMVAVPTFVPIRDGKGQITAWAVSARIELLDVQAKAAEQSTGAKPGSAGK